MRRLSGSAELVADELQRWRARLGRAVVARGVASREEEESLVARLGLGQDQLVVLRWDGSPEAAERLGTLNRTRDLLLSNVSLVLIVTDDDQGQREVLARAFDLLAHTDFVFGVGEVVEQGEAEVVREPERHRGPVRILHLTGLRFHESKVSDHAVRLDGLAARLALLTQAGRGPDVVAIAGDLTSSGARVEYDQAERWLRERLLPAVKLDAGRLLICPGSHDVHWRGRDSAAACFELIRRMEVAHAAKLSWTLSLHIRGAHILFVCVTIARPAHIEVPEDGLVIFLTFDPSDPVFYPRQMTRSQWLGSQSDLVLTSSPHIHQASPTRASITRYGGLNLVTPHPGGPGPHTFNLIELRPDEGKAEVQVWTFSPDRDEWLPDRDNHPPDGTFTVPLGRPVYT